MLRRIGILLAVLAVSGLSGCSGHEPEEGPGTGDVEVLWSFPPDRDGGCAAVPEIATVRATVAEASREYIQTIECREGQSILIPDVEEGTYTLWVDALAPDGALIYGATVTGVQVDEGGTQRVTVMLSVVPGTIRLEWALPTSCASDGVRDILVQVFDGMAIAHDNTDDLYYCDDGFVIIEGNWIRSREPSEYSMYVYGLDAAGVRTHDWAECDLVLESGVENPIAAELVACDGGDCCPTGLCRELCP